MDASLAKVSARRRRRQHIFRTSKFSLFYGQWMAWEIKVMTIDRRANKWRWEREKIRRIGLVASGTELSHLNTVYEMTDFGLPDYFWILLFFCGLKNIGVDCSANVCLYPCFCEPQFPCILTFGASHQQYQPTHTSSGHALQNSFTLTINVLWNLDLTLHWLIAVGLHVWCLRTAMFLFNA